MSTVLALAISVVRLLIGCIRGAGDTVPVGSVSGGKKFRRVQRQSDIGPTTIGKFLINVIVRRQSLVDSQRRPDGLTKTKPKKESGKKQENQTLAGDREQSQK